MQKIPRYTRITTRPLSPAASYRKQHDWLYRLPQSYLTLASC